MINKYSNLLLVQDGNNLYSWVFFLNLESPGGESNGLTRNFSDLKFEAFKQSKWNFQYL